MLHSQKFLFSSKLLISSKQNLQTSSGMYRDQLARMLRLRLYRSKLQPIEGRSKKKWSKSKKLVIASEVGAGSLTVGGIASQDPSIGPIYEFENTADYDLPMDYNIQAMQHYFNSRPIEIMQRTFGILGEIVPYFSRLFIWEHLIRRKIKTHEGLQKKYAVELREMLTRLGPCFIKLGQAVSIRPDILPSAFLFELQKLCDAVPSFPTKDAIEVIESELGVKVTDIFEGLDPEEGPIAAASLGQVYRVKLVENDKVVAVKVQRPDMHHYVLRDIYIMRFISRTFQWIKTTFTYQRPFDVALLDTFANATLKELDYINEASNQRRCKEHLEPRLKDKIYVPEVHNKKGKKM